MTVNVNSSQEELSVLSMRKRAHDVISLLDYVLDNPSELFNELSEIDALACGICSEIAALRTIKKD